MSRSLPLVRMFLWILCVYVRGDASSKVRAYRLSGGCNKNKRLDFEKEKNTYRLGLEPLGSPKLDLTVQHFDKNNQERILQTSAINK